MALAKPLLVLTLLASLAGCGQKPQAPRPPPGAGQVGSLTPGVPAGSGRGPASGSAGMLVPGQAPGMGAGGLTPGGAPGTATGP